MYAYLLRMTGDLQLAADLVQESFVRYLDRYGDQKSNRALLYTIARNAALDIMRRHKADAGVEMDDHADPGTSPEQTVIDRQALTRMLMAVQQLAPMERELIALVVSADLSYREIARMLNISEANVKVKVHRARVRLREILASEAV
ncbi:hypothetical protein JCM12296A_26110 [Desulfosarcina cetonica]